MKKIEADLESTIVTQICIKAYYNSNDKESYEAYAIMRSYNCYELDWDIHLLDTLLEASYMFKDTLEVAKYLEETFELIEEISLEEFMKEVLDTSKELGRWGL